MRISFSLHQTVAFLKVAELGSFSEAAKALGISQPALSRTIRLMEEAIGTRLFDRDTRNVSLSPAGAALQPVAQRIALEFDSAFGELGQFFEGRRGRVTIAALPSAAAVLLPQAIARFQMGHPGVEVVIRDDLANVVASAVADGQADLGLTVRPTQSEKLSYRPLVSDDFVLVCRADDPFAAEAEIGWRAFADRPFIAMAPTSSVRAMTDAAFLQLGLSAKPLYECSHLATTVSLVAAGLGVTALPKLTLPLVNAAGLVTRRLTEPTMRRSIGVLTRTGRALSPAAERFFELLCSGSLQLPY
ncbi:LysR family transcriptional regulator [Aliidongia dinghuensis]|uniref:LysR family transcriptional regulator n=1 Tax=Aliidongia dinghuensis TaxID=1867774 RepID=A0A8J2YPW6_9PROT|nr:LysR family transcriptional regulator [Aliidongia dinghuensis]GGF02314.1 LysR family transcriptional regulator [Aliidongia dinghuensis]